MVPAAVMVRIPATEYHFIARVLDVGAQGLMVPMVESEEQARLLASSAKYPPAGRRGAGFGLAHDDFAPGDILEGMRVANEEGLLIAQIESARGVAEVGKIAAVEGIDVLWIGHFDLTNSLGIPGQFTHPKFVEAVDKVRAACREHGKALGFMASGVEEGRALLAKGFRILAYGRDIMVSPHDPGTFYAALSQSARGNAGSLYRSKDMGETWQRLDHGHAVDSTMMTVAVSGNDPDRICCAARLGQVFGTEDGGKSWQSMPLPAGVTDVRAVACI